jgi:hypothetical protein
MTQRALRIVVALVLAVASGACSYRSHLIVDNGRRYGPVSPQAVSFGAEPAPAQPYRIVGVVAVNTTGSGDEALLMLADEAAAIGANHVANLRIRSVQGRVDVSGLAVRVAK